MQDMDIFLGHQDISKRDLFLNHFSWKVRGGARWGYQKGKRVESKEATAQARVKARGQGFQRVQQLEAKCIRLGHSGGTEEIQISCRGWRLILL